MSDQQLRALEAAWRASGSGEDEVAWLLERVRAGEKLDWESYLRLHELDVEAAAAYLRWRVETGDLGQERVQQAAALGHEAAAWHGLEAPPEPAFALLCVWEAASQRPESSPAAQDPVLGFLSKVGPGLSEESAYQLSRELGELERSEGLPELLEMLMQDALWLQVSSVIPDPRCVETFVLAMECLASGLPTHVIRKVLAD